MTTLELVGEGVLLASLSLPILWLLARTESEAASRHRRLVLALGCANALIFAPLLWAQVPDVGGRPAAIVQAMIAPAPTAVVTERPLSALSILAIVWSCISMLALGRTVVDAVKLRALIKRARPAHDNVLESEEITVPCATSIGGRPVILIPRGLRERLNDQAFACVLTHEKHHLDRKDETWALFVAIMRAPFAFHPLTTKLIADISLAREEAVDALVACSDAHTYASALLEVASLANHRPGPAGAVSMGAHALQKRVAMLTNPQKRSPAKLLPLLAATVVLAAVGMIASPARAAMVRADTGENAMLDPYWPTNVSEGPSAMSPIILRVGTSTILAFPGIKHSEIGDPRLAESCVQDNGTMHITGNTWGTTTLTVFTDKGSVTYPLIID